MLGSRLYPNLGLVVVKGSIVSLDLELDDALCSSPSFSSLILEKEPITSFIDKDDSNVCESSFSSDFTCSSNWVADHLNFAKSHGSH